MGMFKRERTFSNRGWGGGGKSRRREPLKDGNEMYQDSLGRWRQREAEWYKDGKKVSDFAAEIKAAEEQGASEEEQQAKLDELMNEINDMDAADKKEFRDMVESVITGLLPHHIWEKDEENGLWSFRPQTDEEIEEEYEQEQQEQLEARLAEERYEALRREQEEQQRRQQRDAMLTADNLASEFKAIFESQIPEINFHYGTASGSFDTGAVGGLFSGDTDVFMRKEIVEKPRVAGSMAIVVSSGDVFYYRNHHTEEQAILWLYTIQTLEASAVKCGLQFNIFLGGAQNNRSHQTPGFQLSFPNVRDLLKRCDSSYDTYTRQKESIEIANFWHEQINPGGARKVTMLVTMFPENPGGKVNKDWDFYQEWLHTMGQESQTWAKDSHLFCIGCKLESASRFLEGNWVRHGIARHFQECFASAQTWHLDSTVDLIGTISAMSEAVARV